MEFTAGSVPLPPLFPSNFNFSQNDQCRSTGQLSWLSPKAGLITCSSCSNKSTPITVSFQLKDFCDTGVSDLTSVLCVGFRLAFSAMSATNSNDYIASYVAPISDPDLNSSVFNDTKELDLETIEQSLSAGVRQTHKDSYSLEMELQSLYFLLSIFHKSSVHFIPLSSLHSRISNSGKEELYRYIGSSSLKRRQFIERRSYIFYIAENDVVFLQPPEIYTTVCLLTGFLLSHGGVTSSDALFAFFNNNNLVPSTIKETIKTSRINFMSFLSRHLFAFAPFPSQFYVSVRRNLPYFDYNTFIKKNFSACVFSRTLPVPNFPVNQSIFSVNNFDLGENVTNNSNFKPSTTSMTPIFQAQKAKNRVNNAISNTSVWQNEMGFFEHQHSNNSIVSLPGALPGKVPIVGSTAIVGRSANAGFNIDLKKIEFSKIDVSRRPTELCLPNRNSPIPSLQKLLVNVATQTDFDIRNNDVRFIGSNNSCKCRCTCGDKMRIRANEALLNVQTCGNFLFGTDLSMSSSLQRSVSVQDQALGLQRPLFSAPVEVNSNNSLNKTSASKNLFNTIVNTKKFKNLNELDLHDSFFNHTSQPFVSVFLPTTTAASLGNGDLFLPINEFGGFDMPSTSADSAVSSASSSGVSATTSRVGQQQSQPMPIDGKINDNVSKNNDAQDSAQSNENGGGCHSTPLNCKSNAVDLSIDDGLASQERSYDPFGKPMPFEVKLSSLKL